MQNGGLALPAHPDFVAQFDAALRGGPLPPGLIARDMAEVDRRFAVYRNNVAVSLAEALAARFPVIRRLVGEAFFTPLARLYAETDRPRSPVLAEWGEGFSGFLAGFPPLAAYPYLADVARIEFARGQAFHAADAAPIDPTVLASLDPQRVRLTLHPSVSVLRLGHPAVSIWARNQPGGDAVALHQGPETALILRDATHQVPVHSISAGDCALVQAILAGHSLSLAADAAHSADANHNPQFLLVTLMRAGAIIAATE